MLWKVGPTFVNHIFKHQHVLTFSNLAVLAVLNELEMSTHTKGWVCFQVFPSTFRPGKTESASLSENTQMKLTRSVGGTNIPPSNVGHSDVQHSLSENRSSSPVLALQALCTAKGHSSNNWRKATEDMEDIAIGLEAIAIRNKQKEKKGLIIQFAIGLEDCWSVGLLSVALSKAEYGLIEKHPVTTKHSKQAHQVTAKSAILGDSLTQQTTWKSTSCQSTTFHEGASIGSHLACLLTTRCRRLQSIHFWCSSLFNSICKGTLWEPTAVSKCIGPNRISFMNSVRPGGSACAFFWWFYLGKSLYLEQKYNLVM